MPQSTTCCMNHDCIKKDDCGRYNNIEFAEINFKAICDKEFDYQWYWHDESKVIKVEENCKGDESNVVK